MAFRVEIGADALSDLKEIESYLMERSPGGARNVMADLRRVFDILAFSPRIGRPIEGTTFRYQITPTYRYRIVYRLGDGMLVIRRVYHPRQLPDEDHR